jgi:hypothetical protein
VRPCERARLYLQPAPTRVASRNIRLACRGPPLDRIGPRGGAAADLMLPPPAKGSRETAERVAISRSRVMPGSVFRGASPAPAKSSRRWRNPTLGASIGPPPSFRAGVSPGLESSPGRSPISMALARSGACISPRRSPTAA